MPSPTVSVLIPVHNGEAFLAEALESALAQEYDGRVEIVVVDDGSTDASREIAELYRARVIRQANAGTAAAVNAARAAASGELHALLDADDRWPADRLAHAVEALGDAGLVYGDLTVIDGGGEVVAESWLEVVWEGEPPAGRCFGALLAANAAGASSIVMRADLSRALGPIPPELRCADWWLALSAARVGPIAYCELPRAHYRWHDHNIGLGTSGATLGRAHVRRALTQRWFLTSVTAADATPLELALAWNAFERNVDCALEHLGNPFETVVSVTDADRARARAELASGHGDFAAAVRAAALDPFSATGQEALEAAWERCA
jgi:glycosyltransferase involved in cell wall biosynthesis